VRVVIPQRRHAARVVSASARFCSIHRALVSRRSARPDPNPLKPFLRVAMTAMSALATCTLGQRGRPQPQLLDAETAQTARGLESGPTSQSGFSGLFAENAG
jgi:hypothetical protein